MMRHLEKHFSPYLEKFERQDKSTRIALLTAAFGMLFFLLIAITLPFQDTFYRELFPKDPSKAQEKVQQQALEDDFFEIPESLVTPASITASASEQANPAINSIDGKEETFWNSGQNPKQWVELDLGKAYPVSSIWLKTKQITHELHGNEFPTHHLVFAGPNSNPQTLVDTFNQTTKDGEWLEGYYEPPLEDIRYIRVLTTNSNTYVAWNEIEVYTPDAVEVTSPPKPLGSLTASPSICSIPAGKSTCQSTIAWSTTNATSVRLVAKVGTKETLLSSTPSGSLTISISEGVTTLILYSGQQALSMMEVRGKVVPTPIPDKTGPKVTIAVPSQPDRSNNLTIAATATDPSGVTSVQFLVDNKVICTDTSSPYTCVWRIPNKDRATHAITAKAYDNKGNIGNATNPTTYPSTKRK